MKNNPPTHIAEVKPKSPKPAWCVKWADPRFDLIFAVCYFDYHVVIYQLQEDKKIITLHSYNLGSSVNKCDFAPWGLGLKLVAVSSEGQAVLICREDSEFTVKQFSAHQNLATSVSWAPACSLDNFLENKEKKKARSMFATSGCDGNINIWEVVTSSGKADPRLIHTIEKAHLPNVRDISWSNNGFVSSLILASGGDDKQVKIHKLDFKENADERVTVQTVWSKTFESSVWRVSFNFSGNLLALSHTNANDVTVVEILSEKEPNVWEPVEEIKNEK